MDLSGDEEAGQILPSSEMGQYLYKIALMPYYKYFLEVGTWKGNGTTRCVTMGLIERQENGLDDFHFWSIESNQDFHKEACQLWDPKGLPFLHLLYGKLHTDGLMDKESIVTDPQFQDIASHFYLWYEQDQKDYAKCPYLPASLFPPTIDVLILDGGEFSGYADWLALKEKSPKVVCLDDTLCLKNKKVFAELLNDPKWLLRKQNNDRNGWAIFERSD
jgi:hypothetical protein